MMAVKKLLKRTRARKKKSISSPVNQSKLEKNDGVVKEFKQKKTLVIAQEIKFARVLASNDKKARAKMLKKLVNWITVRSQSTFVFTETDFLRLWKGLFYCMWMSDKPLVQEELAENISNLIHCFDKRDSALLYTKCTFKTLATEWFGIDQYRIDKFQMLARRILRQTFVMCKKRDWSEDWTLGVAKVIEEILLDPKASIGFKFHITEIFMEELAKVCEGNISEELVTEMLRPFALFLAGTEDDRQVRDVMKNVFRYLIIQSDVGLEYMEKFEAWRKAGYPTGSIDAMKKVEVSDEEEEDEDEAEEEEEEEENEEEIVRPKALDPRAGRVDVELPQIPFNPSAIAELIKQYKFHPKSTSKTRRQINRLIKEFTELAKGEMPLGVHKVEVPQKKSAETNPKKAAKKLLEFEEDLYADSAKNRGKKKKKPENSDDAEEPAQKKLKKSEKSMDSEEISEENSDVSKDSESLAKKSKKKSPEKQKKTKKPISEEKSPSPDKKSSKDKTSPKKKSLQKEFKVKPSKIKTKKLKFAKSALNGEILDGIDDFTVFKKATDLAKQKSPKKETEVTKEPSGSPPSPKKQSKKEKSPKKVVKKLEIVENVKIDNVSWLNPVISKLGDDKTKFKTPTASPVALEATSSAKKRVKIALQNNMSQHTSEYFRQLRLSPQIPYDANAKPRAGVLKSTPLASPVNPFYKKL